VPGHHRTRFLKGRKHRVRTRDDGSQYVVAGVFEPRSNPEAENRLELSTFGVDGLTEGAIWDLARDHWLPEGQSLRGRADVATGRFLAHELIYEEQIPPPRHGSFIDWPVEAFRCEAIMIALQSVAVPVMACPRAAEPGRMRVQRPQKGEGLEDEKATQSRTDRAKAS
jgi:hypothetical protein